MHQKKGLFQEFTGTAELEVFERAILEPIEKEPCMVEELANEFHKRQDIKSYTEYQNYDGEGYAGSPYDGAEFNGVMMEAVISFKK